MSVCNMSVKMSEKDMEDLALLKKYYSLTLGIVEPDSSLMKTAMRDMLNQIKKIYIMTISNNANLSKMAIEVKFKDKTIAHLLSDNCNTPIIALTIIDEIMRKIVNCRNRSEILRCISKISNKTERFHIASEDESANINDLSPETYYGKMVLDISKKCVMVSSNFALAQAIGNYEVIAYKPICIKNEAGEDELFKIYSVNEIIDFLNKMKCDTQGCMI